MIVIDEAHHAGAGSYEKIMNYFEPGILYLGMTASPERTDDIDIFKLFDYHIAYEIRLQQALEHDFLCPFHYFGITDLVDVNYEKLELSDFNLLCSEKGPHLSWSKWSFTHTQVISQEVLSLL